MESNAEHTCMYSAAANEGPSESQSSPDAPKPKHGVNMFVKLVGSSPSTVAFLWGSSSGFSNTK